MTNEQYPLLPLDEFRKYLQWHPYHFWGMSNSSIPVNTNCNGLIPQYGFQHASTISRSDMQAAILKAEHKLAQYLNYDIAPRHRTEILMWPQRADNIIQRTSVNALAEYQSVQTSFGYVQAIGVEAIDLIQADVPVTMTVNLTTQDTFTLTVTDSSIGNLLDPNELAVFFSSADRYDGSGLSQRWRIDPIRVEVTGNTATITGAAWLVGKPALTATPLIFQSVDPSNANTFVATLDVARVYTDPNGQTVDDCQATLIWETWPWPWYCQSSANVNNPYASDPAAVGKAVARAGIRDSVMGVIAPSSAVYNASATPPQWQGTPYANYTTPDRVQVRYLAGLPLINGQINPFWAEAVCTLAIAELPGPICACKEMNVRIAERQVDLARTGSGDQFGLISGEDLANPFGTRRGQVETWKRVKDFRNLTGVLT